MDVNPLLKIERKTKIQKGRNYIFFCPFFIEFSMDKIAREIDLFKHEIV